MLLDQNRKQLDYQYVVWKFDTSKLDQSTLHKLDTGVAGAPEDEEDQNSVDSQGNEVEKRPVDEIKGSSCCTIF